MIIINDIEQGSEAWHNLRLGIPSASNFNRIVTSTGERSKSRDKYLDELFDEIITGERVTNYKNKNMERGNEREDESRSMYEMIKGVTVQEVGFCFFDENKTFGCSPDGLVIGGKRGFETKDASPHIQRDRLENGWSEAEHKQQVQGSLYVTRYDEWDRMSYCRKMDPVITRIYRDEPFIKKLAIEIRLFTNELKSLTERYSV